jgi:hypothetical protein
MKSQISFKTKSGGGERGKLIGEPATANQLTYRRGRLKQNLLETGSISNYILFMQPLC